MTADVFPTTQFTWIEKNLAEGDPGRREVNGFLMRVYAPALRVYFAGTSYRNLGTPEEIVDGFLADRLSRGHFLAQWRESGLKLRRWLANGLLFYCKEQIKKNRRETPAGDFADATADPRDEDPGSAVDKAFLLQAVRAAMEAAEADCIERGLALHWTMFSRYHLAQENCNALAAAHSLQPDRAWVMICTAKRRFVAALRDILGRDLADPRRVDDEFVRSWKSRRTDAGGEHELVA